MPLCFFSYFMNVAVPPTAHLLYCVVIEITARDNVQIPTFLMRDKPLNMFSD